MDLVNDLSYIILSSHLRSLLRRKLVDFTIGADSFWDLSYFIHFNTPFNIEDKGEMRKKKRALYELVFVQYE